jgi:pyruvate/2-oxoglutarate dehydrogenase complex dihydrolipoamide dehydrogenase (E3) component
MKKYDLVIIGAGSGGLSAAAGAAKLGLKVLLVEKNKLGGDCLWHGCIPSKTLIHEADKLRVMREEKMSGEEINFSNHFEEAKKRIKMVQEAIGEHDSVKRFTDIGCDVKIGTAKFVGKNKVVIYLEDDKVENFKFKKCIISTGSRPFIPEIYKTIKYFTNESIFDIAKFPETMIVVGGGSIGVEIASAFAMFGTKIKMILKEDRVMPREEPEIGEFIKEKMQNLGVAFYAHTDVKEVYEREVGDKKLVHVDVGDGVILQAETLFVATGRLFNSDLDLDKAGVDIGTRKEVMINDYLETTNKNIYAIGDINGFRLFTHAAGYQARAAIQNIIVPNLFGLGKFFKREIYSGCFSLGNLYLSRSGTRWSI